MNKLISFTLATAVSAALLAQPVLSQNIVVTPAISHEQFVETVSKDLDRKLKAATYGRNAPRGEGITIVRFSRDASGDTADVSLYRASGNRRLDRAAMRAVGRLTSLDRVPSGVEADQIYQANIVFASDRIAARHLQDQLATEEAARIAAGADERKVFAFGSAAARPTS